jgi:hypothetical protein
MRAQYFRLLLMLTLAMMTIAQSQPSIRHTPIAEGGPRPHGFHLDEYRPIPFSPVPFTIFSIPDTAQVSMFVTDSVGHVLLDTIYTGILVPGTYRYDIWDAYWTHSDSICCICVVAETKSGKMEMTRHTYTGILDIRMWLPFIRSFPTKHQSAP